MADTENLALINAEIDGELDARQRGELARRLLADPDTRVLRDQLHRLCALLDTVEEVEPPSQLQGKILGALPPAPLPLRRPGWSLPPWRYAALAAGILVVAVVGFETVNTIGPASTELVGTIAATRGRTTLDTVRLPSGPVAGRVSLYRDAAGLGLSFELVAGTPVEVLVASDGHTLRVKALGSTTGPVATSTSVALPGFGGSRTVDLTFLKSGRAVGRATLNVPDGH
jgi:anti-sigma-K factor RskA